MSEKPEAKLAIVTTTPDGETEVVPLSRTNPSLAKEAGVGAAKVVFAALPYVGAILNEALFDIRGRVKQERFNNYVLDLGDQLGRLDASKIDYEYLRSEEFGDVMEDILFKVVKSRGEMKRAALVHASLQEFQGQGQADFTQLYLGLLEQITEAEIRALVDLEAFAVAEEQDTPMDYTEAHWGCSPEQARQIIHALIAKGFAMDTSGGRFDAQPLDFIEPTELGRGFIEWMGIKIEVVSGLED